MTKLIKQDRTLAETSFNSLRAIKDEHIHKKLVELLGILFYKCGQKIDATELTLLSSAFNESIKAYSWITTKELEIILERGRKGDFGEYYGLNINTFEKWIEFWDKNERSKHVKSVKTPEKTEEQLIKEKEYNEALALDAVNRAKKRFKETGELDEHFISQYTWLKENNKLNEIPNLKEVWQTIIKETRPIYIEGLNMKVPTSTQEAREIREEKNALENEKFTSDGLHYEYRKQLLIYYYKL